MQITAIDCYGYGKCQNCLFEGYFSVFMRFKLNVLLKQEFVSSHCGCSYSSINLTCDARVFFKWAAMELWAVETTKWQILKKYPV